MLLLRRLITGCFTGLALLLSANSQAIMIAESGDAGDLTATAQLLPVGTDAVTGTIESAIDADLYGFSWGGGLLTIDALAAGSGDGTLFDSQLFLFDSLGTYITEDDDSGADFDAQISLVLAAGNYFVGVSGWGYDPVLGTGRLIAWSGDGYAGTYTLAFTSSVPEPSTLALLGVALTGLGFTRRRKKTQPVSQ